MPSPFSMYTTSSVETLPVEPGANGQPPIPATQLSTILMSICHKLPNNFTEYTSVTDRHHHICLNGHLPGKLGLAVQVFLQTRCISCQPTNSDSAMKLYHSPNQIKSSSGVILLKGAYNAGSLMPVPVSCCIDMYKNVKWVSHIQMFVC